MYSVSTETLRRVLNTKVAIIRACFHAGFHCDVRRRDCILDIGQGSAIGSLRIATEILRIRCVSNSDRLGWRNRLRLVNRQSVTTTADLGVVSRAWHTATTARRHRSSIQLIPTVALRRVLGAEVCISCACLGAVLIRDIVTRDGILQVRECPHVGGFGVAAIGSPSSGDGRNS